MNYKIIIFFLFSSYFLVGQDASIIISPIATQKVYEESRITVYFSTLKHFETIDFTTDGLPEFANMTFDQTGDGKIIFDPEEGDEGKYTVSLIATSEGLSNSISFDINVVSIDKSSATIFYIDPATGDDNASGSEDDPFKTLSDFIITKNSLLDDNTYIFLKSGFHGSPVFTGTRNNPVRVLAAAGHTPRVKRLNFSFTTNWHVSGLDISPQNENITDTETLINVFAGSKFIEVSNCYIYAIEDASVWTDNEMWYAGSGNGIVSSGTECLFKNNYLKNTWFTVEMRKQYNEFSYNIINWFGADAVRAIASNQVVSYNQIKNATVYDYDHPTRPQHDDAIQSWTFNNPVQNIKLIGNQIADIADPDLPLPTEIMQGIAIFDGYAEDWDVSNNLVITHHAHGIALYGAKNCRVTNNTVTRNPFNYYFPNFKPWIRINPRKVDVGGDPSFGNLVRNNIMSTYQDENLEPATIDHNIISSNYEDVYADYNNWNFFLADDSPAIDAGSIGSTLQIDQEQKLRNEGAPDAGCFELNASLIDREVPVAPTNILSVPDQTMISLDWDDSSDNTEIAYYETVVNDNLVFKSTESNVDITRLDPGQDYDFKIAAVDVFGNTSEYTSISLATLEEEFMTVHFIPAFRHDQLIKSNSKLMWVGSEYLNIGDYNGNSDAVAVVPFQLPCIDSERSVVSADILMNLDKIEGTPTGTVDAYLVEMRSKSDVLTTDLYQGAFTESDAGIPIAEGYIDVNSQGILQLTEEQQVEFGLSVSDLYETGACNKFAFIRLNSNIDNEASGNYYSVSSADNLDGNSRPLLKIISAAPSSTQIEEIHKGLGVISNPVLTDKIILTKNDIFNAEEAILEIHNQQGQVVFHKLISDNNNRIELNINIPAGAYYVTLLGKNVYAQTRFVKL